MNNFEFLKSVDKNLYDIVSDAEKLFRDEYFEQCIGQTRRFGENVCKKVLGANRTSEVTFDDMLATLKDNAKKIQEKEFIDDLYFLKREGNNTVHSSSVNKDYKIALECLQRAFEVGISYALYKGNASNKSDLLKLRYDTEMLLTGKKSKQTLAEKYAEEKARETRLKNSKKSFPKTKNKPVQQAFSLKSKSTQKSNIFKYFLNTTLILSAILCLAIYLFSVL